jgi:hypothetical protein
LKFWERKYWISVMLWFVISMLMWIFGMFFMKLL